MLRELTSRQIAEWMAYAKLEPFGERAEDLRHGIQTAAIINRWRGKSERTYNAHEFTLTRPEAKPAADDDTLMAKIAAIFRPLSRSTS